MIKKYALTLIAVLLLSAGMVSSAAAQTIEPNSLVVSPTGLTEIPKNNRVTGKPIQFINVKYAPTVVLSPITAKISYQTFGIRADQSYFTFPQDHRFFPFTYDATSQNYVEAWVSINRYCTEADFIACAVVIEGANSAYNNYFPTQYWGYYRPLARI